MSARNHWMTFPGDLLIGWQAFLPPPRGNAEGLIRFAVAAEEAGTRHAVWRPVRLPAAVPFNASTTSVEAWLREALTSRGRAPVFPQDARPGDELWTPARVAFWRDDAVAEEEIGDLGALIRTLRPAQLDTRTMFMRAASPVTVRGVSVPPDYDKEVRVLITLGSDIWLPRVMGMVDDPPENEEKPDWYDNAALAARHTPRLNAFLADLRRETEALGGRWEVAEIDPVGQNYTDQWDESGIRLA